MNACNQTHARPVARVAEKGPQPPHIMTRLDVPSEDGLPRAERRGRAEFIILDRPRARNALTIDVIERLHELYARAEADAGVACHVLLGRSHGTFCAGGDVRCIRTSVLNGDFATAREFFAREFALNARMSALTKPSLCVWNGTVMGGGAGLSCYAPVRVSTELTTFAMPECAIGLYPDVGASWFLHALCGRAVGTWLALTGARVEGAVCKALGLSTHHVTIDAWERVVEPRVRALELGSSAEDVARCAAAGEASGGDGAATGSSSAFAATPSGRAAVEEVFGDDSLSLSEIIAAVRSRRDDGTSEAERRFFSDAAESLASASPTSLEVTLELMRRARGKSLEWCLATDNVLITKFIYADDFQRGVDAVLIKKVGAPPPEGWTKMTRSVSSFFADDSKL